MFHVELGAIGWLVATGVAGRRDRSVAVAAGLVAVEPVFRMDPIEEGATGAATPAGG